MNSERHIVVKDPNGNDVKITQDMLQTAIDQLLRPHNAARAIGIGRERLRQLRESGYVAPFVTIGNEYLYWDKDLARLQHVRNRFPHNRGTMSCWRDDRPANLT